MGHDFDEKCDRPAQGLPVGGCAQEAGTTEKFHSYPVKGQDCPTPTGATGAGQAYIATASERVKKLENDLNDALKRVDVFIFELQRRTQREAILTRSRDDAYAELKGVKARFDTLYQQYQEQYKTIIALQNAGYLATAELKADYEARGVRIDELTKQNGQLSGDLNATRNRAWTLTCAIEGLYTRTRGF